MTILVVQKTKGVPLNKNHFSIMSISYILIYKSKIKNEDQVFGFSHWAKDHINFRKEKKIPSLVVIEPLLLLHLKENQSMC